MSSWVEICKSKHSKGFLLTKIVSLKVRNSPPSQGMPLVYRIEIFNLGMQKYFVYSELIHRIIYYSSESQNEIKPDIKSNKTDL